MYSYSQVIQSDTIIHYKIMEGYEYLTITPISKDVKNKACIDYNEQEKRTSIQGYKWCWDDSKYNKARKGEYFAFLFFEKRVVIHKIEDVKPPSQRLDSWTSNVGQQGRQVLELSNPLKEFSWEEWLAIDGPICKQCTFRTKTSERPLLHSTLAYIEYKFQKEQLQQKEQIQQTTKITSLSISPN